MRKNGEGINGKRLIMMFPPPGSKVKVPLDPPGTWAVSQVSGDSCSNCCYQAITLRIAAAPEDKPG